MVLSEQCIVEGKFFLEEGEGIYFGKVMRIYSPRKIFLSTYKKEALLWRRRKRMDVGMVATSG